MILLSQNDTFKFSCSREVPCFNECCRDLNQFLTPYDILRLKNRLGLSSSLFLERYTSQQTGPETGLPVITLKTEFAKELKCPFVTPSGCSVYEDRPSSCRTYPLMRIASRSRETGKIAERFVLLKEAHCLGFERGRTWTIPEWIENQEISFYKEMNDMLLEIISFKNRRLPGSLDIKSRRCLHMALYDIDAFRSNIFEKNILDHLIEQGNPDTVTLDRLGNDDVALLKLGHQWIKKILFNNIEQE
ncbi:MAG: YkgJ family cysteine cluster protein [Desulfobacterales bacterium]